MIKGIYRTTNNAKNWGLAILKDKNTPLECSIIEHFPSHNYTTITHLTETEYEYERSLLK